MYKVMLTIKKTIMEAMRTQAELVSLYLQSGCVLVHGNYKWREN